MIIPTYYLHNMGDPAPHVMQNNLGAGWFGGLLSQLAQNPWHARWDPAPHVMQATCRDAASWLTGLAGQFFVYRASAAKSHLNSGSQNLAHRAILFIAPLRQNRT